MEVEQMKTQYERNDVEPDPIAWIVMCANKIEKVEEEKQILRQQVQQLTQRVKELEKDSVDRRPIVVDGGPGERSESVTYQEAKERMEKLENLPSAEDREQEREQLTEKQRSLYTYALYNPEVSRKELVENNPFNSGNTVRNLRSILNKGWQLPVSICEKFGLEESVERAQQ
jgi:hypothetical protein